MNTNQPLRTLACLVAAVFLLAVPASAQYVTTGQVLGSVSDETGASLPGARVLLKASDDQTYETNSDESGAFNLINIVPGSYILTAEMPGFIVTPTQVNVRVGSVLRINLRMSPGEFTGDVTVEAEAPQIESVTAQVNKYVSFEEIQNLPLQNRNFLDVLYTVPGVAANLPTGSLIDRGPRNSISIHGARSNQNDFLLDGASNNDRSDLNYEDVSSVLVLGGPTSDMAGAAGATFQVGSVLQTYNLDAVEQVQVSTSMFSAEFGSGGAGGVINVITRSGTNETKGSVTIQQQRDAWAEGTDQQSIKRTMGAFTLGGPIKKDKTHYFFSYERDDHELGFDTRQPEYFVPAYIADMPDLIANHTKRDRITLKLSQLFSADHTLTLTSNLVDERADTLNTIFRYRSIDDAVPEEHENKSFALVLRDLLVFGNNENLTLESVINGSRSDRNYDSLRDDPREITSFYYPTYSAYTIGSAGPDSENQITTFGWSEKLTWATGKWFNKFGIGIDKFEQETRQVPFLSLSHLPDFGIHSYYSIAETNMTASVTDFFVFGQTDWFVSNKVTLNLGIRYGEDDLINDPTIEPRAGLAWDPQGDGHQVIRVGGGVYHDRANLIGVTGALRPPSINGRIVNDEYVPGGPPSIVVVDPDLVLPTVYKFVAGYERQLGRRTSAGITLFANFSRDLFYTAFLNRTDADGNRPDPTVGKVTYYSNFGWSDVYDLELEFRHQFENGSMVQASYTYQDTEGNSAFDYLSGNDPLIHATADAGELNTYEVTGPLPYEIQHMVKLSGVFMLPWGFQLNTVMNWRTGQPYYWYTQMYELPTYHINFDFYGEYNDQRLDDFFNVDLRIAKNFSLGKRYELLLFIDGFNVTDQENVLQRDQVYAYSYGVPIGEEGTVYSETWDDPTLFGPRRAVQIGARFSF